MKSIPITRRQMLKHGAVLAVGAGLGLSFSRKAGSKPPSIKLPFDEYAGYDALGLAELVARGELNALELLEVAIQRAEAVNPKINAIVLNHYELARKAIKKGLPDGPFKGAPFLLKDLGISLNGTITTNGSVFYKDHVASFHSTLVERYQKAGLVIFGKTHSPEFGGSPSSESTLFGATHNPWNLQYSAGGSSGGTAAAIAAGIVPAGHASDGGGSIRIPASCCGLFGMKPTRGRVPLGPPDFESRNGSTVAHAISRSVRDSAALLDVSQGTDFGDPVLAPKHVGPYLKEVGAPVGRLRIALMREPIIPFPVDPECLKAVDSAAKLCESLGHMVEEAKPNLDVPGLYMGFGVSSDVVTAMKVAAQEKELGRPVKESELEPITWKRFQRGKKVPAFSYAKARQAFHRATRAMAEFQQRYDVILSPTMASVPAKLGVLALTNDVEAFNREATGASAFTMLYNGTGQPAMSVPLHWSAKGVPVGVMFAARFGDESTLYRLAAQLEAERPWKDKRPLV
jgi:Asp-tRNA(Asn)/Glu-tRNA(Gln) amidotransferase A subunit family amidase